MRVPGIRAAGVRWRLSSRTSAVAAALMAAGCAGSVGPPVYASASAVALTAGPSRSMVYLARTESGVIAIDLGWWGAERAVEQRLRDLGATATAVTDVFLTHSHRDHIGAWRLVRHARFHTVEAERPLLLGQRPHRGWIPRLAERVKRSAVPRSARLDVRPFARDTTYVFGRDTLYAFLVPGHTAGSAAYLFRGILFIGDAVTFTRWAGFGPARRGYSDDAAAASAALERLWERIPPGAVRHVCTAHAHCRAYGTAFLADVKR